MERAFGDGEIKRGDDVLVVGAGASGATAAIRAAQLGANTWIVDSQRIPFSRQASCATRWVDPMQYHWPADQWSLRSYPIPSHPGVPLPWGADWSFRLARRWRTAFARAFAPTLPLVFYPGARVTLISPVGPAASPAYLDVTYGIAPPQGLPTRYQAVIWAAGFGREICEILDETLPAKPVVYTGPAFWSSDSLQKMGCGSRGANPKVVILGSGDGAAQDLIRALTKKNAARDIVNGLPIDDVVLRELHSAEERAHKHWIWAGANGRHDHALYESLDQVHTDAVAKIWGTPVKNHLDGLLGRARHENGELEDVVLVHRCTHLTCFYGLNRFVVYLLAKYVWETARKSLLVPERTAIGTKAGIAPRYLIPTVRHPRCFNPISLATRMPNIDADVIIVRFGLDVTMVAPPVPPGVNLARRRHSIPVDPSP